MKHSTLFRLAAFSTLIVPVVALAAGTTSSSSSKSSAFSSSSSVTGRNRPWGPEQATGKPNTSFAGDFTTAWASRTEDDQDEWLMLTYERELRGTEIQVVETYNPGALDRVTVFDRSNKEVEVWKGIDPVKPKRGKGTAFIPVNVSFPFRTVKLYLNSTDIKGWNEIDAVGVKESGTVYWATRARASSTFARPLY